MISRITGTIIHADPRYLIVETGGVGYRIHTNAGTLEKQISTEITFWTYLAVRENAMDLYGFLSKEELDLFETLITVSGIGPKTALGIMSAASPATIKKAVATDDPSYLTKVSGIGKKNAEKIVLELKNKFFAFEDIEKATSLSESDALEALKALGYAERDARETLKKVSSDITDTGERVKQALKILGSKKMRSPQVVQTLSS